MQKSLMQKITKRQRCFCVASLLVSCLLMSSGCQTWRSSSALAGMGTKKGDKQTVKEAKNDPFPSPADVGLTGMSAEKR